MIDITVGAREDASIQTKMLQSPKSLCIATLDLAFMLPFLYGKTESMSTILTPIVLSLHNDGSMPALRSLDPIHTELWDAALEKKYSNREHHP